MSINNSYTLSKRFYQTLEQNPEMQLSCRPSHIAVYFRIIEIQNQIGWQHKVIGLPNESLMHYACLSSAKTYYRVLKDLEHWGLFKTLSQAQNQFTARKITFELENTELDSEKNKPKKPKTEVNSEKKKLEKSNVKFNSKKNEAKKPKIKFDSEKSEPEISNLKFNSKKNEAKKPNENTDLKKNDTEKPKNKANLKNNKAKNEKNIGNSGKNLRENRKTKPKKEIEETQIQKLLDEFFGSHSETEKNTANHQKVRAEWQQYKAEGRLKDLAQAEKTGFALQKALRLRVKQIRELLLTFLLQRKTQGRPVNAYVVQKLITDLEQYAALNIQEAKEMLEKALLNGWVWIYPPRPKSEPQASKIPTDDYQRYCSNPKVYEYIPPSRC